MSKRLTDTKIWEDPWFQNLPTPYKLFWKYLCDACDNAGVWKKNIELAIFFMKENISEEEALKLFNQDKERIIVLNGGKRWFIKGFVDFQYGELQYNCPPHRQVITLIEEYNLFDYFPYLKKGYEKGSQRVAKGYGKGSHTLQDKDKDKDKDKEIIFIEFLNKVYKEWNSFCDKHPSLSKIKEISPKRRDKLKKRYEQSSFRDFKAILSAIEQQPFLLGENKNNWRVSFDWLIENDTNYLKVLELRYKDPQKTSSTLIFKKEE